MSEEYEFEDQYGDIVEAEVRFRVKRKLDEAEEQVLRSEFRGMLIRVGSAIYTSQTDKERGLYERQLYDLEKN